MSAFFEKDVNLLDIYGLNTVDPHDSWAKNSTSVDLANDAVFDFLGNTNMNNPQNMSNETVMVEKNSKGPNGRSVHQPPFVDVDPLDGKPLSDRLQNVKDVSSFSIKSINFNSKLFLQTVHRNDSFEQLTRDLDTLDNDLKLQSGDLKRFVQENFVNYVRSKNNLDNIYEQLNNSSDLNTVTTTTKSGVTISSQPEVTRFKALEKSVLEVSKEGILVSKKLDISKDLVNKYGKSIGFIEKNNALMNLPNVLQKCLSTGEYSELLLEYNNAKTNLASEKPSLIEKKIWVEIEDVVDLYRQHLWKTLLENDTNYENSMDSQYDFLPIISKLIDLNVEESPIVAWITSKLENLNKRITSIESVMEKKHKEYVSNLQRATSSISESDRLLYYLQFTNQANYSSKSLVDHPMLVELWLFLIKFVNNLTEITKGFVNCWEQVENFLNGTYQESIFNDKKKENILSGQSNIEGKLKAALNLNQNQINDITNQGSMFVNNFIALVQKLFDTDCTDPASYAFLPPNSNNLSCLRYLPRLVQPILKISNDIGQLKISEQVNYNLQTTCTAILSNTVKAIDYTRLKDYKNINLLETWSVYDYQDNSNIKKCTILPIIVKNINIIAIRTLKDLVFFNEKIITTNNATIVKPPSREMVKSLELQQVTALETVLESLLEYATKQKENPRTVQTLLTLSNIRVMEEEAFPFILNYFQQQFNMPEGSIKFSSLQMFAILDKMYSSILSNYASDLKFQLRQTLEKEMTSIDWLSYTASSFKASDFILEVLMILVQVHKDSNKISADMSYKVTSEAQNFISTYLNELVKPHIGKISTDGLLQLTLDFQFFIQVLSSILDITSEKNLNDCLLACFHNNAESMRECIQKLDNIIKTNLAKTSIQFASFKE